MNQKIAEKLPNRLKKLRQRREISQEELARLANLRLSNVAKLEGRFNSNPTLVTLLALAKVLTGNSIDDLLANKKIYFKKVGSLSGNNLSRNLKELRQEQGISQEELARLSGLKLSNIAKLEGRFNSNPTLATLGAIAGVIAQGSIDRLLV